MPLSVVSPQALGDLHPTTRWLKDAPVTSAAGACFATDERGTGRYVYVILGVSSFWRFDTYSGAWQQLANTPASTLGGGTAMHYDPKNGRVWLITGNTATPTWQYFDEATGAWVSRSVTGLPASWGTAGTLAGTWDTYNVAGGNKIYLFGNNATVVYRYDPANDGAGWVSTMTAVTAAPGVGCHAQWLWGGDADKIVVVRGGATATVYQLSLSGGGGAGSWSTLTTIPAAEGFTTGSASAYDGATNRLYVEQNAVGKVFYLDIATNAMIPAGDFGPAIAAAQGAAVEGRKMVLVKTTAGTYLYHQLQTSTRFVRRRIAYGA